MSKKTLFLFLFAAFTFSVLAQSSDVKSAINDGNKKLEQAMVKGDKEAILSLYSDDIVSLPPYQKMIEGKKAYEEDLDKQMASDKISDIKFTTTKVMQDGNIAVEVGTYKMKGMSKEKEFTSNGKYITVWKKMGDTWKIAAETWNSDNPPAAMKDMDMDKKEKDKK